MRCPLKKKKKAQKEDFYISVKIPLEGGPSQSPDLNLTKHLCGGSRSRKGSAKHTKEKSLVVL